MVIWQCTVKVYDRWSDSRIVIETCKLVSSSAIASLPIAGSVQDFSPISSLHSLPIQLRPRPFWLHKLQLNSNVWSVYNNSNNHITPAPLLYNWHPPKANRPIPPFPCLFLSPTPIRANRDHVNNQSSSIYPSPLSYSTTVSIELRCICVGISIRHFSKSKHL